MFLLDTLVGYLGARSGVVGPFSLFSVARQRAHGRGKAMMDSLASSAGDVFDSARIGLSGTEEEQAEWVRQLTALRAQPAIGARKTARRRTTTRGRSKSSAPRSKAA
jgi:hypothetical protein